jgi:hypothetical protein
MPNPGTGRQPGATYKTNTPTKMTATNTSLRKTITALRILDPYSRHSRVLEYIRDGKSIGEAAWDDSSRDSDREKLAELDLDGWPECSCSCCDCTQPATCTDDGGNACCEACADYTIDDDGNVICSRDDRTETVTESCGGGNQTRSYVRIKPPEAPETDEEGEYALYWETSGNEAGVVSRHSTYEEAKQALDSKDWPRPGDNTHYLCGHSVRMLVSGDWVGVYENGEAHQD